MRGLVQVTTDGQKAYLDEECNLTLLMTSEGIKIPGLLLAAHVLQKSFG
jgi:hypothetical protein